ncbi:hypothetical protein J6590_029496 [Homalodisca vitripennis]|nr:hypothetical protein J6590_029496 [Homalodisca vitripennis]
MVANTKREQDNVKIACRRYVIDDRGSSHNGENTASRAVSLEPRAGSIVTETEVIDCRTRVDSRTNTRIVVLHIEISDEHLLIFRRQYPPPTPQHPLDSYLTAVTSKADIKLIGVCVITCRRSFIADTYSSVERSSGHIITIGMRLGDQRNVVPPISPKIGSASQPSSRTSLGIRISPLPPSRPSPTFQRVQSPQQLHFTYIYTLLYNTHERVPRLPIKHACLLHIMWLVLNVR